MTKINNQPSAAKLLNLKPAKPLSKAEANAQLEGAEGNPKYSGVKGPNFFEMVADSIKGFGQAQGEKIKHTFAK
jgi:hypothetical protein